MGQEDNC